MLVGMSLVYHGAAIQGFLLNLKYVSPEFPLLGGSSADIMCIWVFPDVLHY
ncbi:hypothetical protein DAPPUDRAFT_247208 [Daphnia pulex]|uniref:Uncharacterized protein n=1 Tax=Daphnia pulex TaxID=6669 RepID=E9GRZ1_DAPPU|nr:hypothetical protein DAPPUDRAFT_247208 [Daphnia pulex]|eukprot:EFX77616.1 hypothetical protein DAPPUDRAFT_247208 [Daphnia pulex]